MKKQIRLLDHNIESARGLTVESGRFKGSVSLRIDGTIGQLTVRASELLSALQQIAGVEATRLRNNSNQESVSSLKNQGPKSARISRTQRVEVQSRKKRRTRKESTIIWRAGFAWTEYEDQIIMIASPGFAAEKLRRPLSEVIARLAQLKPDQL